ncbi:hypothetical protein [Candidatus Thiosymbion oneisti]|uniref:hypothetical protein n=1 Tax=Candidatus Thiosymbion oneisti TaxID=589554 RepID=UPI00105F5E87|nr:hypothetical protein [Candidatus Thiosymbion oneisti]
METGSTTPKSAWLRIVAVQNDGGTWLGPLAIVFAALVIGYSLKPLSMQIAQQLSKYAFKIPRRTRSFEIRDMVFPFDAFFSSKEYHSKVTSLMTRLLSLDPVSDLPGKVPFSSSKRYLRLLSPMLWEESERMEAEVRMIGGLFLASVYASVLSLTVVVSDALRFRDVPSLETCVWLFTVFFVTLVLGIGFNRNRLHEVEYTYMNVLLAEGHRIEAIAPEKN